MTSSGAMRIRIVSNIDNGKGLERDYQLLRRVLTSFGHEVTGVSYRSAERPPPADLVLFLEVYEPRLAEGAARRWLVPNVEWWPDDNKALLRDFDLVLCKTEDALAHVAPHAREAKLVGFLSEDRYDPGRPRERSFLHVAGGSIVKGTDSILLAWERYRLPYPLTLVSWFGTALRPRNVTQTGRVDTGVLRALQNTCALHLSPSRVEGWGHAIHEGLSVGAAIAVADAGATRTLNGVALRIPARPAGKQGMVRTAVVAPEDVRDAAERMMALTDADLARVRRWAREAFLEERQSCVARLREVFGARETGPAKHDVSAPKMEASGRFVREAVGMAFPELWGLYGGVVVAGEGASRAAEEITSGSGHATRAIEVTSLADLASLPANYACGVLLLDLEEGEIEDRALSEARRIVKAAGPIVVVRRAPIPGGAGHSRMEKRIEYGGSREVTCGEARPGDGQAQ